MFRLCIVFALVSLSGLTRAHSEGSVRTWVVNPLVKIRPADLPPASPAKLAEIYAARNEFEPFQIALRSEPADAAAIDVDVTPLQGASGESISRDNITVYFEQYLNLKQPSRQDVATGLWPDPLIPRVDRYLHEQRNAFPFTLKKAQTQPVWVEVFVPESAHPGLYKGEVSITRAGAAVARIPIRLHVWNFTLPSTSTLKSSFGLNGVTVLKAHRGHYTNDADLYSLTRLYEQAALLHRVSTHGGTMVPPSYVPEGKGVKLDWHAYDAEVGPFMNGTALPAGSPLSGARWTSIDLRTPATFPSPQEQASYWREYMRHFREKGWADRLFLYLWDEPPVADFAKVLSRGQAALTADSGIRNLVTVPFNKPLEGTVKIWTPLVNCILQKPGFDNFCAEAPPFDVYARESAQGASLWFYQSCASHGCGGGGGEYFRGWPSYMIDDQGAANRVMPWVAWKYRIQGELYYSMNEAYAHAGDPWNSVFLFGGNGDGTLFYPGRPDRIGGHTDIPIESIRLKLIREGMEDYEYLAMIAKLAGSDAADQFAGGIVTKPYQWESDPEKFLAARRAAGEEVNRLVSARPGERGDER